MRVRPIAIVAVACAALLGRAPAGAFQSADAPAPQPPVPAPAPVSTEVQAASHVAPAVVLKAPNATLRLKPPVMAAHPVKVHLPALRKPFVKPFPRPKFAAPKPLPRPAMPRPFAISPPKPSAGTPQPVALMPEAPKPAGAPRPAPPAGQPAKPGAPVAAPKPVPAAQTPKAAPAPKPATVKPAASKPVPSVRKPVAAVRKPFLAEYQEPKKEAGDMSTGRIIADLVVKLAVVLGIAYGAIYVLRGLMGRQGALPGRKGDLKVLESASLGPNRSVHLVRVGGKVLVLGSTPDNITSIGEVEDPESLASFAEAQPFRPFASHLDAAEGATPKPAMAAQVQGGARHIWDKVQEIRGLRGVKGGEEK